MKKTRKWHLNHVDSLRYLISFADSSDWSASFSKHNTFHVIISTAFYAMQLELHKANQINGLVQEVQVQENVTAAFAMELPWAWHWGQDKMAAISQTTLSNAFSWKKMSVFRLKFHWSLFLSVQLTIFRHCFRWWLGADQATSHYLKQWW